MKATTVKEAWGMVDEIFPTDYKKDEQSSERAGYPIYRSTADGRPNNWISNLGDRLEVNLENGKSINIWIEVPAEEETAEAQGISEDRELMVKRIQRATYVYTREYLMELENREKEETKCKEAQEAYEKDGIIRCTVLTAENNAKVMLDCMKEMRRAVEILADKKEDVEDWMLAGIAAMLDKCNEQGVIPFDLPGSICGVLGVDWR